MPLKAGPGELHREERKANANIYYGTGHYYGCLDGPSPEIF